MNNILTNKAASLERCLNRIRTEYIGFENELLTNVEKRLEDFISSSRILIQKFNT